VDDSAEFDEIHTGILSGTRDLSPQSTTQEITEARAAEDRIVAIAKRRMPWVQGGGHVES